MLAEWRCTAENELPTSVEVSGLAASYTNRIDARGSKMKSLESLNRSAFARLNQARRQNEDIAKLFEKAKNKGLSGSDFKLMRAHAEKLLQCVHEFSAYRNAADTD